MSFAQGLTTRRPLPAHRRLCRNGGSSVTSRTKIRVEASRNRCDFLVGLGQLVERRALPLDQQSIEIRRVVSSRYVLRLLHQPEKERNGRLDAEHLILAQRPRHAI